MEEAIMEDSKISILSNENENINENFNEEANSKKNNNNNNALIDRLIYSIDSDDNLMEVDDNDNQNEKTHLSKKTPITIDDYETQMSMHIHMNKKALELERLDVRQHFIGNVKTRIDKLKSKL
jgi:hypothetical protein